MASVSPHGSGVWFFQNHLIPLFYFGFSAIKKCCPQPNAVLSWGLWGALQNEGISSLCFTFLAAGNTLQDGIPLFCSSSIRWLTCVQRRAHFNPWFLPRTFSFGTTFIWAFMSIVQLSQFSLTGLGDFFSLMHQGLFFNWRHSPLHNPSSLVFPTNFIGTTVRWAQLLMDMLVNVGTQHTGTSCALTVCNESGSFSSVCSLPLVILSVIGLPTLHLSNNYKSIIP